ncbi:MAG: metalloregulator ArsR/SmtB family transcription factor [Pseudomonadota bacterium]
MTPTAAKIGKCADETVRLLKVLAHPARLLICTQLRETEMSVSHIETELNIKQPRLSRELGKLRDEGFVTTRRSSKVVFYKLSSDPSVVRMLDAVCAVMLDERPAKISPSKLVLGGERRGSFGVFARTVPVLRFDDAR